MVRPYRGVVPQIDPSAYVDESAQIIGDVHVGARSSIWLHVAIRGDVNYIRIGTETSIQDNSVLHVERDTYPCLIGNRVTVGHRAVLHGCVVEDRVLIGIGAIVLNGSRVGSGSVIADGSLVTERMEVPPNSLVMGTPGKVRRQVTEEERIRFERNCQNYVELSSIYKEQQS